MHLFLRDSLRLSTAACFCGAIINALAFWHYIYGYAAPLLPLLLWSADRIVAGGPGRARRIVSAALLVWFLLLSSQIQIVLLEVLIVGPWALLRGRNWADRAGRLGHVAAAWAIAALLAGPIVATLVTSVPDSQRQIWDLSQIDPLTNVVGATIQRYSAILFGVDVARGIGGPADIYGTFFPGAIGLVLLAIAVVMPRRHGRERFLLALLALIPLANVIAVLIEPYQGRIALLGSFQFVRVRHLMPAVLAMNVALGLDWVVARRAFTTPGPRRALAAVLACGALILVCGQIAIAARQVLSHAPAGLAGSGWRLSLAALGGGLVVLVVLGSGALILARRNRGQGARGPQGAAMAVVPTALVMCLLLGLVAERTVWARAERDLDGSLGSWSARVAPTPAERFIAAQPGGGRVLSIGDHANRALAGGLDAVDRYETVYPLRYHELFGALIAPHLETNAAIRKYYEGWGNRAYAFGPELDHPIADLIGVRWLYVNGAETVDPAFTKRFSSGSVTVYENPTAFPRAFLVHRIALVPDRSALQAMLGQASSDDLRSTAYLAAADATGVTGSGGPPDPADRAVLVADAGDRVVVDTHAASPALLVLADTFASGWVADVDGESAPIVPADDALRGVAVAAGDHRVTFSYRPVPTIVGFVVAALTALVLLAWVGVDIARRRHDQARIPTAPAASAESDAGP